MLVEMGQVLVLVPTLPFLLHLLRSHRSIEIRLCLLIVKAEVSVTAHIIHLIRGCWQLSKGLLDERLLFETLIQRRYRDPSISQHLQMVRQIEIFNKVCLDLLFFLFRHIMNVYIFRISNQV